MRLIDADELKKELSKRLWFVSSPEHDAQEIMDVINNAPTIPQTIITEFKGCDNCELDRPKGNWNYIQAGMCVCPFCGAYPHKDYKNFCPNCGADMRGEKVK